jgi:tRNA dimethylallyltransferase
MKKLLIICGPTAVGKTNLAIHLAKVLEGELVSADSRQVYGGMDIGTGKELPANVKTQISNVKTDGKGICFYEIERVKVWAYDLVDPKEEFSVGQYEKVARKIIKDIWKRKKLPILVGGTGLYIKAVVDGIPTAKIPRNKTLRRSLEEKSAHELYEILAQLDPTKAASLNLSDRKNPRRLIRAIEIADYKVRVNVRVGGRKKFAAEDVLFVGLKSSLELLDEKVENRVEKRIEQGMVKEIKYLFEKDVTWNHQSMKALGYRQFRGYFEGKQTLEEVKNKWITEEIKYTKRQMTWFKKDKRINWFDISKRSWQKNVEKLVKKWHNS